MLEHKQVWFDFHSSLHHGRLHHGLHRIRKGMRTFLTPPRASLHSCSLAKSLNLGLRHENLQRWRSKTQGIQERLSFFFLTCSPGCPQADCIYTRVTLNVWYPSLYLLSLWDYRRAPTHLVWAWVWCWAWNPGLWACSASSLPVELQLQPGNVILALGSDGEGTSYLKWLDQRDLFDLMGLGVAGGPGLNVCSVSPRLLTVAILPVRCETRLLLDEVMWLITKQDTFKKKI